MTRPDHLWAQADSKKTITPERSLSESLERMKQASSSLKGDDVFVPVPIRKDLTAAKSSLLDSVLYALNHLPVDLPGRQRSNFIHGYLARNHIHLAKAQKDGCPSHYGCVWNVDLFSPVRRPDIIVLTTSLNVPYGTDDSLYVLERIQGEWHAALRYEADGYTEISGAHAGMQSAWIDDIGAGHWAIAIGHFNLWPVSNWQYVQVVTLTKGDLPERPIKTFSSGDSIYVGVYDPFSIRADGAGFLMRYHTNALLDTDRVVRIGILHVRRFASGWQRLSPLADHPVDVIDDWLRMEWAKAREFSDSTQEQKLRAWHSKVNSDEKNSALSFGDAYECSATSGVWHVEIDADDVEGRTSNLPPTIYFKVNMEKDHQQVMDVSALPFAECPAVKVARYDRKGVSGYLAAPESLSSSSAR